MSPALLLLACSATSERERVEPSFIEVALRDVATGSEDAPLPFTNADTTVGLEVRTLDVNGEPYPFTGELKARVRPGRLTDGERIDVTDGEWSGSVRIRSAFGPTRIWLSDEDARDERTPSWATGVTDALWYALPTIDQVQATDDHETNALDGEFAEIRVEDREVVVSATDASGFWAADLDSGPGNYSGMYVYTFSRPDEGVEVGARIVRLAGIDQEYLASTQLSFPTIEVAEGETLAPPDPFDLADVDVCDSDAMEMLEGSRVSLAGGVVPDTFAPGSEEYTDFEDYGQWPVSFGGCVLYAESGGTVPDWYPPDHAGQTLAHLEGMLKEVYGKWILIVLDADDIVETG